MSKKLAKRRAKQGKRDAGVSEGDREQTPKVEHAYRSKVLRDSVHDLISLDSEDRFIPELSP